MQVSDRTLVRLAAAGCALYLATTLLVTFGLFDAPDLAIDRVAYAAFGDGRRSAWNLLSLPGGSEMAVAAVGLATFLAWVCGSPRRAAVVLAVSLTSGLLVDGLKDFHGRPYPHHDVRSFVPGEGQLVVEGFRGVSLLPANASDPYDRSLYLLPEYTVQPADLERFPTSPANAYPSGHTMGATVSWGVALLLGSMAALRTWRIPRPAFTAALVVAIVVGVNRVMVRTHWASDVIGSWGLGAAFVAMAILADRALARRWPDAGPAAAAPTPQPPSA